jgi:hypothetical protein
MIPLHNTVMGQRLIEGTLPDIARELKALNVNMNRIAEAFEKKEVFSSSSSSSSSVTTVATCPPPPVCPVPEGTCPVCVVEALVEHFESIHGEGACDCRPEPENEGYTCPICIARLFIDENDGREH